MTMMSPPRMWCSRQTGPDGAEYIRHDTAPGSTSPYCQEAGCQLLVRPVVSKLPTITGETLALPGANARTSVWKPEPTRSRSLEPVEPMSLTRRSGLSAARSSPRVLPRGVTSRPGGVPPARCPCGGARPLPLPRVACYPPAPAAAKRAITANNMNKKTKQR